VAGSPATLARMPEPQDTPRDGASSAAPSGDDQAPEDTVAPDGAPADDAGVTESGKELSEEEQELFASYVFPDPRNRRISAVGFWILAALLLTAWLLMRTNPVASVGLPVGAAVLGLLGVWFWLAAWRMSLDQGDALVTATREVGFPVGHASAMLGWRGWRSRPTWRILLYSAEDPPTRRGLVEVDSVDASVLGAYTEDNEEEGWDGADE